MFNGFGIGWFQDQPRNPWISQNAVFRNSFFKACYIILIRVLRHPLINTVWIT